MNKKTLIEIGWKKLACGHIVRLPWQDDNSPCPTCAEIKAAEGKRGEEVLEMVKGLLYTHRYYLNVHIVDKAYNERFKE